ncbi:hypothetical protein ACFSL4_24330 [Streptomyces caeni]|uniref:DUF2946 domain-containing protein n=1 Tax=Streptomyces caeni TaxID=2307231 RepID=A0ABW4IVS4_9ACTN
MGTRRTRYGQLLLFAALLFGIITMHALGHPSQHEMSSHGVGGAAAQHRAHAPEAATTPVPSVHAWAPPMTGTDPLSVCLAVLGSFTLLVLLAAAAARPRDPHAPPVRLARPLRALWPDPPPPGALLTRLSVLRQ